MKLITLATMGAMALPSVVFAQATTAAPATQTSATTSKEVAPAATKKFGAGASTENIMAVRGIDPDTGKEAAAPLMSTNAVNVNYAVTPSTKLEVRQYFGYASDFRNIKGDSAFDGLQPFFSGDRSYEPQDTMLRAAFKTDATLLGSEKLNPEVRLYLPTGRLARDLKRNMILRADVGADYTINPTWSFNTAFSPRLSTFASSTTVTDGRGNPLGQDGYLRIVVQPAGVTYTVNDALSAYANYSMDVRSVDALRGIARAEKVNGATYEVGMNYTVGPLTINPAFDSDVYLGNADGSLGTSDSRVYAWETNYYTLNLYAAF